jgi:hypothetical protein
MRGYPTERMVNSIRAVASLIPSPHRKGQETGEKTPIRCRSYISRIVKEGYQSPQACLSSLSKTYHNGDIHYDQQKNHHITFQGGAD